MNYAIRKGMEKNRKTFSCAMDIGNVDSQQRSEWSSWELGGEGMHGEWTTGMNGGKQDAI